MKLNIMVYTQTSILFLIGISYKKNGEIVIEIDDQKSHIDFSQPFCQCLWSVALFLPIFFNTYINFHIYLKLGVLTPADSPNLQAMEFADHIFFIARRLKNANFNPNLVNAFPSVDNSKEFSTEIENANTIYCGALTFMFSHEFSHQYLGHTRIENTYSRSIKDEIAADDTAVDYLKPEFDDEDGHEYTKLAL